MPKRALPRRGEFTVYLLECADGTYYAGYTRDIEARLALHNAGRGAKYVRSKRPVRLAYARTYRYYKLAILAERKLKTRSRAFKEALVREFAAARSGESPRETPAGKRPPRARS